MFDIHYFKRKFSAVPDEMWHTGTWEWNGKYCAGGLCGMRSILWETLEFTALKELFIKLDLSVMAVNDWGQGKYNISWTPKKRILTAIEDIIKLEPVKYEDITEELAILPVEEVADIVMEMVN